MGEDVNGVLHFVDDKSCSNDERLPPSAECVARAIDWVSIVLFQQLIITAPAHSSFSLSG